MYGASRIVKFLLCGGTFSMLRVNVADDTREALNKFCKPTVVFEWIDLDLFWLIVGKNLEPAPYKNVFGIWHFVGLKRSAFR